MKRVLLTGGTCFIGKHLAKRLCDRGNLRLVCLVREESSKKNIAFLERLEIELRYGDLCDAPSLKGLADNVDCVFHLAAKARGNDHDESAYYDINVRGTENLVKECKRCSVKRFIHISTTHVYEPVVNGTEETEINPDTPYGRSKAAAEKIIVASGLDYVIVRAANIFGSYDPTILLPFKLAKRGVFPIVGRADARIQPLFVKDFVVILEKIMDLNIKNQILIAAGNEKITVKKFIRMMGGKRRILFIGLPLFLCWPLSRMNDALERRLGIGLVLNSKTYNFYTKSQTYDVSKLQRLVNPQFTDLKEGMNLTREWVFA